MREGGGPVLATFWIEPSGIIDSYGEMAGRGVKSREGLLESVGRGVEDRARLLRLSRKDLSASARPRLVVVNRRF